MSLEQSHSLAGRKVDVGTNLQYLTSFKCQLLPTEEVSPTTRPLFRRDRFSRRNAGFRKRLNTLQNKRNGTGEEIDLRISIGHGFA